MLSAASDWATTDKLYGLYAKTSTDKFRTWSMNVNDEMSMDISIDGEWAAAGTVFTLDFTEEPNVAIAYAEAGCSDDGV